MSHNYIFLYWVGINLGIVRAGKAPRQVPWTEMDGILLSYVTSIIPNTDSTELRTLFRTEPNN